jgi:hypothetical protein
MGTPQPVGAQLMPLKVHPPGPAVYPRFMPKSAREIPNLEFLRSEQEASFAPLPSTGTGKTATGPLQRRGARKRKSAPARSDSLALRTI